MIFLNFQKAKIHTKYSRLPSTWDTDDTIWIIRLFLHIDIWSKVLNPDKSTISSIMKWNNIFLESSLIIDISIFYSSNILFQYQKQTSQYHVQSQKKINRNYLVLPFRYLVLVLGPDRNTFLGCCLKVLPKIWIPDRD